MLPLGAAAIPDQLLEVCPNPRNLFCVVVLVLLKVALSATVTVIRTEAELFTVIVFTEAGEPEFEVMLAETITSSLVVGKEEA
jgi:hypothetical protein